MDPREHGPTIISCSRSSDSGSSYIYNKMRAALVAPSIRLIESPIDNPVELGVVEPSYDPLRAT